MTTEAQDFGDVGQARQNFLRMSAGMHRLKEISDNVEADQLNIEKYVKELTDAVQEMFISRGSMFVQEALRTEAAISRSRASGYGVGGGDKWIQKGIMEHRVMTNLKAVNGEKGFFRQWHQKFTTALGQYNPRYEEIVHYMTREIDLGKDLGAVSKSSEMSMGRCT